jgi:hypothetical protein
MTMNSTPDHLSPDHLDDGILSALLDGDTEAATAGAGVDAAAHLRACDRCAGRQAELSGARAALADAPVEALDELTRRRLVAAALAVETAPAGEALPGGAAIPIGRARARRHPALIGSAAAVVLALLVGVPFVLDSGGTGGRETLTAQAPYESAAGSFLGDLGDLSDRGNVRLRLSGVASDTYASPTNEAVPLPAAGMPASPLAGGSSGASGLAADPSPPFSTTTLSPVAGTQRSARPGDGGSAAKSSAESPAADSATTDEGFSYSDPSDRDRADTDRCVAALLDGPARGGKLVRSGTGTYQGRPAIVASFELAGGTEAFITDRSDCSVLDRFSV